MNARTLTVRPPSSGIVCRMRRPSRARCAGGPSTCAAVLVLAACAGSPAEPEFAPPPLDGRALLRATSAPGAGVQTEGEPVEVEVEWTWAAGPLPPLQPAAERARFFVAEDLAQPFPVGVAGAAGLDVASGSEAERVAAELAAGRFGRVLPAATSCAALWPGSTATFTADHGTFAVAIERALDGTLRPIVTFTDADRAVLDVPLDEARQLLLVESRQRTPVLVWCVRVREPARAATIATGRAQLAAAAEPAVPPADVGGRDRAVAVRALTAPATRRHALVQLGSEHATRLAIDVALLGDDDLVRAVAEEAARELAADGEPAWCLERAAARALATRAQQRELAPELASIGERHLGETLRTPSALLATLSATADTATFATWLRNEHAMLLGDAHPATRLRAFEWLDARGCAPAGFDPLASKAARRAALMEAEHER